jgi:hypothetical protein
MQHGGAPGVNILRGHCTPKVPIIVLHREGAVLVHGSDNPGEQALPALPSRIHKGAHLVCDPHKTQGWQQ